MFARMAESVDALVSNTSGAIRAGSTPAPGTRLLPTVYMLPGVVFLFALTKKMGGCLGQKCCLLFVCVFGGVLRRVFRGGKICALYFKICQTYFEIGQTYFLFAPMWGKRTENQFSFFSVRKAVSGLRFPRRRLSALVCCGNGCLVRTKVSAQP